MVQKVTEEKKVIKVISDNVVRREKGGEDPDIFMKLCYILLNNVSGSAPKS